jgi:hypothetical protein
VNGLTELYFVERFRRAVRAIRIFGLRVDGFNLNGCDGAASFSEARKLSGYEYSGRVALIFRPRG